MTRRSKSGAMSTGARGNGYRRSCAPPARSGTRGATSACGRHVHSAAATTAAPALGSPCNNLCELSRPAAWLGRHVSACQQARPAIYHRADYVRRKADSHNAHNRLLPLPVLGCDGGKLLMSVPLDLFRCQMGAVHAPLPRPPAASARSGSRWP